MKLTFNFRAGLAPLTLDLPGESDQVMASVKKAIEEDQILDLTDTEGQRVVIPASAIGYVIVPSRTPSPVGFGRM